MGRRTVTVRGRPFDVDGSKYGRWWTMVEAGEWEPSTFAAFEDLAPAGGLVVDIGAWIGATALFAAAGGADVVAFEPDPVALPILKANLAMNPELGARIDLRAQAVGAEAGRLALYNNQPGNSGSSLVDYFGYTDEGGQQAFATVDVVDGLAMLESLDMERVALVKIDIEGAEYDLIPRIAPVLDRFRPALHLSLHPLHVKGADEAERTENRRRASLRIADALSFYGTVRRETDAGGLDGLDGTFAERAARRPFPRGGWVFTDAGTG